MRFEWTEEYSRIKYQKLQKERKEEEKNIFKEIVWIIS